MQQMQRIVLLVLIVMALVLANVYFSSRDVFFVPDILKNRGISKVIVGDVQIRVEIADDIDEWNKGLSGRRSLAPNRGMLFVFDDDKRYGIHMKDMLFPIDIIWVRSDGRIVYVKENIVPDTYPETFSPSTPVRYVLEVPAGFVEMYNISIGDVVEF